MVQPFPELSREKKSGTMASADFSWQALLRTSESYFLHTSIRPPQLRTSSFHLIPFPDNYRTLICFIISYLPALYQVPVRQARCLPQASFRFQPTMDTLAIGYTLPVLGVLRTAPGRVCSYWANQKNPPHLYQMKGIPKTAATYSPACAVPSA